MHIVLGQARQRGVWMNFIADSMLGRLAKWLRALGFDTIYQSRYRPSEIQHHVAEGRIFLTRKAEHTNTYPSAIYIHSDHVGQQLAQLKAEGLLSPPPLPFTRCLRCNTLLAKADLDSVHPRVPDYVLYENASALKYCPSCGRYYWPGTHRDRMERQLHLWGLLPLGPQSPGVAGDGEG